MILGIVTIIIGVILIMSNLKEKDPVFSDFDIAGTGIMSIVLIGNMIIGCKMLLTIGAFLFLISKVIKYVRSNKNKQG